MKVALKDTFSYKAFCEVARLPNVILREDLRNLGSDRQVSRALKKLVTNGTLTKLGYGVYAKLKKSTIIDNEAYLTNGFLWTGREALTRLGIGWELSKAEKAYNLGLSQQVPASAATQLNTRFRRKLSYDDMEMRFEQTSTKSSNY